MSRAQDKGVMTSQVDNTKLHYLQDWWLGWSVSEKSIYYFLIINHEGIKIYFKYFRDFLNLELRVIVFIF